MLAGACARNTSPQHFSMTRIALATANPHKLDELRAIFAASAPRLAAALCSLDQLPGAPFPEPAEVGTTFLSNATIKAAAYAQATGLPCLADDSGLEVDALDGAPGVISSHYSTHGLETGLTRQQRDDANNVALLASLANIPWDHRTARFRCTMVLALQQTIPTLTSTGTLEGRIGLHPAHHQAHAHPHLLVPRGAHGFGYDPLLLLPPHFTASAAELTPEAKNARSHRGHAARAIAARLIELFPDLGSARPRP